MSKSQIEANRKDIKSGKRLSQKNVILNLLTDGLPMTFEQIQKITGFKQPTVVGRLSELASDGLVVENTMGNCTYYSPVYTNELRDLIKERKSEEKTKRVLNSLIKDDEALNVLMEKVFLGSFELHSKGYSNDFIKEDIIAVIKKEIK